MLHAAAAVAEPAVAMPAAEEQGAGAVLVALLRCACAGSEAIQAALARHAAVAADPSAVFPAPQPLPGDVVAISPPWFVTCITANMAGISHAPGVRAACEAARAKGTYAVGGNGHYVAADASPADLRALLDRVTGSGDLWLALAGGYRGAILPALQQRVARRMGEAVA